MEQFAFDKYLKAEVARLIQGHGVRSVIETGTWTGGTAYGLAELAEHVDTIEVNTEYYNAARDLLSVWRNVDLHLGRSQDLLPELLTRQLPPVLYYLDAHWEQECPLLRELELIVEYDPAPLLVLHDFQVPGQPTWRYDTYDGQPFCYEWVEPILRKIKQPWKHYFNHEAAGHQVGVLFVVPEL